MGLMDVLQQWYPTAGKEGGAPALDNLSSTSQNPMNFDFRKALYLQNMMAQNQQGFGGGYNQLNAPMQPAQSTQPAQPPGMSMDDFGSSLNQYLPGAQHMANVLGGGGYGGSGNAGTDISMERL
jgi:hypothetical protein